MFEYETDEDRDFFQRHRDMVFVCVTLLLGIGIFFAARALSKGHRPSVRLDDVTMVRLLPPPPPLPKLEPTPPPQQPAPERPQTQKMVEQQPVQDEKKSEAPKEKPHDAPAPLGTSITGPGSGADIGLGNGAGIGGGYGSGGGVGGSKYGWYASEVQNRVRDALTSNPRTRNASLSVVARIWLDSSGRITKARVAGSGDPALDAAVQNDVLTGLQLTEAPPGDMPLPIVMRIGLKRPR